MARRERSVRRTPASRSSRDSVLIVVEGRCTEKKYFCDLRMTEKLHTIKVEVVHSSKTNPTGIVECAQALIVNGTSRFDPKSFEYVYVVFDHDDREQDFRDAIALTQRLDKAYKTKYKTPIRFIPIPSIPNFELWFLLHFKQIFPHEMSKEDVFSQLKKYWPAYQKNAEGTYQMSRENLGNAQRNSVFLRQSPQHTMKDASTDVDIIIGHLLRR